MKILCLFVFTCLASASVYLPALSPLPAGCPQHIGPPCPRFAFERHVLAPGRLWRELGILNTHSRYYDNPYADGNSTTIPPDVKTSMEKMLNVYIDLVLKQAGPTVNDEGWNIFVGAAGRGMIFLRLYKNTKNETYLTLARQYVDAALSQMQVTPETNIAFLESSNGVHALAAVLYDIQGDSKAQQHIDAVIQGFKNAYRSNEVTYDTGRAGLLMAGRFVNNHFGPNTIPANLFVEVAEQILAVAMVDKMDGHLSWRNQVFKDIIFWGQGHGSTGVIQNLLEVPEIVANTTYKQWITDTLNYYLTIQFKDGNFPTPLQKPYPADPDVLVQWCHGSPGFIPVLTRAWQLLGNEAWLNSAKLAADNVWQKGLLTKGLMLGHGISGNTYMQLFLHQATKDPKYLYRAIKFQEFVLSNPIVSDPAIMRKPTPSPFMPYVGSYCGAIALWSDMLTTGIYNMPGFAPYV